MHATPSLQVPVVKDLVLVGGGHAHVAVLRRFGMRPMPGVRLTLISRDIHTPYSGMLPGLVAGHYTFDECHIDLGPLARFAGARLFHTSVEGLDPVNRLVFAAGRPPIPYDVLSINTGSRPATLGVDGAERHAMPVKPIDRWLQRWQALQQRVIASQGEFHLVVVGGGAGGVEMALAMQFRLRRGLADHGDDTQRLRLTLISADPEILATHAPGVRRRFERILNDRGIDLESGQRVVCVGDDAVRTDRDLLVAADAVVWATQAAAPAWPGAAGLATDQDGFIRVNDHLQSLSHAQVFACGDVASMPDPRPKSGVFAVRQGPVLADNLRRALHGRSLRRYRPQRHFLGLISTGDRSAVASRGGWSLQGAWLWNWKDRIDRRFMQRFNQLPAMQQSAAPSIAEGVADADAVRELSTLAMRCGGCGAKVGSGILTRVMQRLPRQAGEGLLLGMDSADDAAVLQVPTGRVLVQSVDHFRAFVDDPYLFGRIAANHALGDLFAMGAEAHSALAVATLPYAIERQVEQALFELMSGAVEVLQAAGAVLAGGHTGEGPELAFGLAVNGLVEPQRLLRKAGLREGDALILTKPIGTGTLLAADMRGRARGRWIDAALITMQLSNRAAMDCLREFGVTACTDVTGFGLVGHLLEMVRASAVQAELDMQQVPLLDGAVDTASAGILSSLQPHNLRLRRAVANVEQAANDPRYALMFDPQTAGGLLAAVPAARAEACVTALIQRGYLQAAVIGAVSSGGDPEAVITLR